MVVTHAMDLFNDPFFIGFNRELGRLNTAHKTNSQTYPPYDLLKLDEDTYRISLAVAGFSREDINISVDNGTLIIKGELVEVIDAEVVHKGIAGRKFARQFVLSDTVVVRDAALADGILSIQLENVIPEEQKPRKIAIK